MIKLNVKNVSIGRYAYGKRKVAMDVKFFHELSKPSEFSKELLAEFLAEGYATEQFVEGEKFIRMTGKYFEELGEYIIKHPNELCKDYWRRLIDDTGGCSIVEFIKQFCVTHLTVKQLTDGEVDFCSTILEELE
jgi:hypothetical protein